MNPRPWLKHYDPGVPHQLDLPPITIPDILEERAEKMPDGIAVTIFNAPTTYKDLNSRANQFAHALKDWGIQKGDRVALVMANSPNYVSAQFGILKAGAIAVPVNPLYTGPELIHVLSNSGARFAVVLSLFAANVTQIQADTSLEKIIVVPIPGMDVELPAGAVPIDDFLAGKPTDNLKMVIEPDDPALILYTGGTTGRSKGAVLHHRSQIYCSTMLRAMDPRMTAQKDSFILVNPLFHIMGNAIVTFCIHVGVTIHLVPQYDPGLVLQTIHDSRPTWFPGVPTMFIGVMNHPDVKNYDLTSIRYCVSAAAPFPLEAMEQFESITGCRVCEMYGLTEGGSVNSMNPFINPRKTGSIGIPTPGMDMKIINLETGADLPPGREGELVIKGPPVMKHYLGMPEETRATLIDGWLHTGDIAYMDEDGFFFIVDRLKDMIITGGFNVYPRDVDEVLYEHPKIAAACAIGVPDDYRGEAIKAFVVLRPGTSLTEKEVQDFCRERLTGYKIPRMVEFRDSLPTSIIGKILRKELREEEKKKSES